MAEQKQIKMDQRGLRRNPNPIREARKMQRLREKGLPSSEIGPRFQLSDSAVRNKLRLLNLPRFIIAELESGRMPESIGRALVSLYAIPEKVRERAERHGEPYSPSSIIRDAISGESSALLSARINKMRVLFHVPY